MASTKSNLGLPHLHNHSQSYKKSALPLRVGAVTPSAALKKKKKESMRQHTLPLQAQRDRRKNQPREQSCSSSPGSGHTQCQQGPGHRKLVQPEGSAASGAAGKHQMKKGASEELKKGKRMKDRLHHPVRGHPSRQSLL